MIKITAAEGIADTTAEELALKTLWGMTQPQFKKLLKNKSIHINGEVLKKSIPVAPGDVMEIFVEDLYPQLAEKPEIVYEDENMLIYRKPAGVPCGYAEGDEVTVLTMAEAHMKENKEYNPDILSLPYLVTPLDDASGGLVLIAKDDHIYTTLTAAMRERRLGRFYTALTARIPRHGERELHHYMISNPKKEIYKLQDQPGNKALPVVTRIKELAFTQALSLIEAEPITDRPMQIRTQLAHTDCPVLGDEFYGDHSLNKKFGIWTPVLWQTKLTFYFGESSILSYLNGKSFSCQPDLPIIPGGFVNTEARSEI